LGAACVIQLALRCVASSAKSHQLVEANGGQMTIFSAISIWHRPRRGRMGIVTRSVGGQSYGFQIQNIDRARFEGIEFTALYDAPVVFAEGTFNYYRDIEFCNSLGCGATDEADYGTNHVPPRYTVSLTLGTRLLDEKLTLGGRITYVDERALPVVANPNYSIQTEKWVPYILVDAFASYQVSENIRLDFSADNIFDRYYVDALNNLLQPAPGRTMTLTERWFTV
jgi:outer membrane receptor protein involved in Fe transport